MNHQSLQWATKVDGEPPKSTVNHQSSQWINKVNSESPKSTVNHQSPQWTNKVHSESPKYTVNHQSPQWTTVGGKSEKVKVLNHTWKTWKTCGSEVSKKANEVNDFGILSCKDSWILRVKQWRPQTLLLNKPEQFQTPSDSPMQGSTQKCQEGWSRQDQGGNEAGSHVQSGSPEVFEENNHPSPWNSLKTAPNQ